MITNQEILEERLSKYNQIQGARVGDFLHTPCPDPRARQYTRFTHDWRESRASHEKMQTGGTASPSYYLSDSGLSYSGGLDPGINTADLIETGEFMEGGIWFFNENRWAAHNGVNFMVPFRVFRLREGSDESGLFHLGTGIHIYPIHESPHGYKFQITKNHTNHKAFHREEEVRQWLEENNYAITRPLTGGQQAVWPHEIK